MSKVLNFHRNNYSKALQIQGSSELSILGGPNIQAVNGEPTLSRERDLAGFDPETSLVLVVHIDVFKDSYLQDPREYLGDVCTFSGKPYRIQEIQTGDGYFRVSLVDITDTR